MRFELIFYNSQLFIFPIKLQKPKLIIILNNIYLSPAARSRTTTLLRLLPNYHFILFFLN
jgi:hypothetical protein